MGEIEKADRELVALARGGDKQAFGDLAERHQPLAMRMALHMVSNSDVAGELVQEGILQAYLSLGDLRDAGRFGSWLCGIVLNVCRSYLRAERIATLSWEELDGGIWLPHGLLADAPPDPQEVAEERELHRIVMGAVCALPEGERTATLLFYYGQRSMYEIAALLGISVGAVKVRLHRARGRLRDALGSVFTEAQLPKGSAARRNGMLKVKVEDIRQARDDAGKHWSVIVLADETRERFVPIWVGEHEGNVLALELRRVELPRPLTTTLTANLLRAAGAEIEEVRIETLKDSTFYAVVKLRTPEGIQEVDARPSDALPLAAHFDKPIHMSAEVLETAGVPASDFPEGAEAQAREQGMIFTWEESLLGEDATTIFERKP